ncbi:MAG: helix-turn-helix domain-containing protein [Ruminiclostridium sp.]|nr:helix-turn-helix domain-containing protein [Ruminiclostridium sp.]
MYKLKDMIGFGNNRRSVFLKLFISYILIILLTVSTGGILYKKVEQIMKDNTNRYNLAMLEQVRQVMDGNLKEVDQLTNQISFNPKVVNMLSSNKLSELPRAYQFLDLKIEFNKFKTPSNFIYYFYVYFFKDDVVITANTKINSKIFYSNIYSYKELDYNQWYEMLKSYNNKTYLPSMVGGSRANFEDKVTENNITYIQSLPFGEKNYLSGSLVILINEKKIKELMENIKLANSGYVYILNSKNEIIMNTYNNPIIGNIDYSYLKKDTDIFEQKIDGNNLMISYSTSTQNDWKYISVVPENEFMERVNHVKAWGFGIILFYFVGGLVLSYIMAYKNYNPIKNILNAIIGAKKAGIGRISNEYEFIKRTILDELNEKKNLNEIIHQQMPVVRNNFLRRLIKGYVDYSSITDSSLDLMGINFISDHFAVLLVDIEDCSRFSEENSESKWTLARIMLTDTMGELADEHNGRHVVELEKSRLAVLINFRNDRLNDAIADMGNMAGTLKDILENKFSIFITVGISNVHNGISCIEDAFKEASKAVDYKIVRGINRIIYYTELKDTEQYYYYPMEIEMKLMNFVKAGDYDNVEKILDDVYEENFKSHHIGMEIGQCLFFNIMSTLIKVLNSFSIKINNIIEDKFDIIKQLTNCSTVDEMHVKLKSTYKNICNYIKMNQNSSSQLLERIIEHIEHNYADNMLSLNSISEKFNITPQYLSAFFKNNKGMNISDYIAKARIEKGKTLLKDKTLTLSDIARIAGFANEAGLIRVFKKYEGVTPGKYRD